MLCLESRIVKFEFRTPAVTYRWEDHGMGTYRQYCPIARASEILAERWNPLIVRNLMFGADTFSAIAGGVPTMSRSMLIKRLNELERAGLIQSRLKPDGRGRLYGLTEAGADLAGVLDGLAAWGERWVEVTPDRSDPGFTLWAWCQVQLDRSALPPGRVVVAFIFPDERPGNRRFWLLVEHGDAEVCYTDPGGEPDLTVVARSLAFVDWHRGERSWRDVLRSGDVKLIGPTWLRRSFPSWNRHTIDAGCAVS
jgi:DNA-binding HxlR family transcriptional regulator